MTYQLHPLTDIQGIGEAHADTLQALGVDYAEDLLLNPTGRLRFQLAREEGFPTAKLFEFTQMADLIQVEGLTAQHAEALTRAGYRGLEELSRDEPAVVKAVLGDAVTSRLIPESASHEQISSWQQEAQRIAYQGRLVGSVQDEDGDPIDGAEIIFFKTWGRTSVDGRFYIPGVPYEPGVASVTAEGFKRLLVPAQVAASGATTKQRFTMTRGAEEPDEIIDEYEGGVIRSLDPEDAVDFVEVDIQDVPAGTPVQYRRTYADGSHRIQSLFRVKRGAAIEVKWARVDEDALSGELSAGDVFVWDGTALEQSSDDIGDVRRRQRFAHFGDQEIGTIA